METIESNGVEKLVNADALICDYWSGRFIDNYDFKNYQKLRDELNKDVRSSSSHESTYTHINFSKINNIKNLSNILENLIKDPSWTEVILTFKLLGSDNFPKSSSGKLTELKKICIDKIVNYYTTESRDEIINNILS